jgi:tetratricopeptide (TPR) repeat protein
MAWALGDIPDPVDAGRASRERNEAVRLIRELHEEFPHNPIYQYDLVIIELPMVSGNDVAIEKREAVYRKHIGILERLLDNPPWELTLAALLAGSRGYGLAVKPPDVDQRSPQENIRQVLICVLAAEYSHLSAFCLYKIGKKAEGEALYHKAIHLLEAAPGWNLNIIARLYHELAKGHEENGRLADAITAIDRSLEYRATLLREQPDPYEYRGLQNDERLTAARLFMKAGREDEAVDAARAAFAAAVRLTEDFPSLQAWKLNWSNAVASNPAFFALLRRAANDELAAMADKAHNGDGWAWLAYICRGAGDHDRALEAARRALEINPKQLEALVWFGQHYRGRGEFASALDFFERATTAHPDSMRTWLARAELEMANNDNGGAIKSFDRAGELPPHLWYQRKRKALAHFKLGQFDEALSEIEKAVSMRPDDGSNLWWIPPEDVARCPNDHFRQEMLAQADRAVALTQGSAQCYLARGRLHAAMGQFTLARGDFEAAVGAFNAAGRLGSYEHYQRALCYLLDSDRAAYRAAGNEILARFNESPHRDELHWTVWTCVLAPGAVDDYPQVVSLASRAQALVPEDVQMKQAFGAALFRAGQFAEALKTLEEAESAPPHPNSSPVYARWFLAMAHHALGNSEAARQWYDRASAETEKLLTRTTVDPVPWNRRLTLELLRAEAANMFGDASDANSK